MKKENQNPEIPEVTEEAVAEAPAAEEAATLPAETAEPLPTLESVPLAEQEPIEQPPPVAETAPQAENQVKVDRSAEFDALLEAHPELQGQFIPNEVFNEAFRNGKPLLASYDAYLIAQMTTELESLRKENEALKQNAEAAAKAPVTGLTDGGSTNQEPEDIFLKILGS